jgi:L-lactate utilization protein LutC
VLARLGVDGPLSADGIDVTKMARDDAKDLDDPSSHRAAAIDAGLGLTGADYAIAETGSVVLAAGQGVSRIVSLVPPVHVAVVERGSVVPSLDELFTLLRRDYGEQDWASYVNIISGPSRSADIEYTLVTGVHGPGEVHLVLLDEG